MLKPHVHPRSAVLIHSQQTTAKIHFLSCVWMLVNVSVSDLSRLVKIKKPLWALSHHEKGWLYEPLIHKRRNKMCVWSLQSSASHWQNKFSTDFLMWLPSAETRGRWPTVRLSLELIETRLFWLRWGFLSPAEDRIHFIKLSQTFICTHKVRRFTLSLLVQFYSTVGIISSSIYACRLASLQTDPHLPASL